MEVLPDMTMPHHTVNSGATVAPPLRTPEDGQISECVLDGRPIERLLLREAVDGGSRTLDGAWWPRSCSLGTELPTLIGELQRRGVRISRVAYNRLSWDPAPRRLVVAGRVIRLGWFETLDPHLVSLSGGDGQIRLDLLVVPPDTEPRIACWTMSAASVRDNHRTATAILQGPDTGPDRGAAAALPDVAALSATVDPWGGAAPGAQVGG